MSVCYTYYYYVLNRFCIVNLWVTTIVFCWGRFWVKFQILGRERLRVSAIGRVSTVGFFFFSTFFFIYIFLFFNDIFIFRLGTGGSILILVLSFLLSDLVYCAGMCFDDTFVV